MRSGVGRCVHSRPDSVMYEAVTWSLSVRGGTAQRLYMCKVPYRLSGGAGATQAALRALPHTTTSLRRHRQELWEPVSRRPLCTAV